MGNLIKVVLLAMLVMVLLSHHDGHWLDSHFDYMIDDSGIEWLVEMVVVALGLLVVVVALFASVIGSVLLVSGLLLGGVLLFAGAIISWPLLILVTVIWLIVRDKPNKNNYVRY